MTLRDILPELLKTHSKVELAERLGVSRPTLDRYIKQPELMTVRTLKRAAKLDEYQIDINRKPKTFTL